ncbi:formylglycine-generating enzyme family protein [Paenibacillus periandrae]|uniref:formylglycine-generating enzyme family protein n=1 Tax=Paenibacillus periandrae TaxID=1761741 RepID=UPI001F08CC25|nr:formylglycine-generating enzyme family protein [Paenibacillus periandrae]
MNRFYKEGYERLTEKERNVLLASLTDRHPGLEFKHFASFERFGMHTDTAVYGLDDSEFVFVPGNTLTLGWHTFAEGFDVDTKQDVEETMEEYEILDSEAWIRSLMSPVRTVSLPPMLVERKLREIGWRRVFSDSSELIDKWKVEIEKFEKSSSKMLIFDKKLRLSRSDAGTIVELYDPVSYEELLHNLRSQGFSLLTEDEWEYLCGGGSRTLWRWGDNFIYNMHLKHFEEAALQGMPYDLELPNQFGICIAFDPYKYEVVDAPYFLKGGDGGSFICGGTGMAIGYLPTATYFRLSYMDDEMEKVYKADIGGSYTFYRKVIKI